MDIKLFGSASGFFLEGLYSRNTLGWAEFSADFKSSGYNRLSVVPGVHYSNSRLKFLGCGLGNYSHWRPIFWYPLKFEIHPTNLLMQIFISDSKTHNDLIAPNILIKNLFLFLAEFFFQGFFIASVLCDTGLN
jgi:hypothetical protein